MLKSFQASLVVASHFIEATRDSGYKSLGSALAELIDNAFEAKATSIHVLIGRCDKPENSEPIAFMLNTIRTGKPSLCRDVSNDPSFRPWRRAFFEARALPAGVLGPVLCLAFARLASARAWDILELRIDGRVAQCGPLA